MIFDLIRSITIKTKELILKLFNKKPHSIPSMNEVHKGKDITKD